MVVAQGFSLLISIPRRHRDALTPLSKIAWFWLLSFGAFTLGAFACTFATLWFGTICIQCCLQAALGQ